MIRNLTQCNRCISAGGGDCTTCEPEQSGIGGAINHQHDCYKKPQSVRSQRSFQEQMQTLYQNIDNMVYAAEYACNKDCEKNQWQCSGFECAFRLGEPNEPTHRNWCKLISIREIIGDHFPQHDIKEVELSN